MSKTFHNGELAVQQQTGELLMANAVGRIISDTIHKRVHPFIENQAMVIISSTDTHDNVWVSILLGDIGFTSVFNEQALSIDRLALNSSESDIFYKNITNQKEIGSLFIELSTRRRFRINGTVQTNQNTLEISVNEAYANCPKYIQQREINIPKDHYKPINTIIEKGTVLNQNLKNWIMQTDTFFIGSKSNHKKLDASHRGGNKGFIEINGSTLKIPDYKGNSMYNTLGNIYQNSKAGLLFIDFEKGHTLQLSGTSSILFDQNSEEDFLKTGGTGRYLLFTTEQWIQTENHHKVAWGFLSNSPFNPSF